MSENWTYTDEGLLLIIRSNKLRLANLEVSDPDGEFAKLLRSKMMEWRAGIQHDLDKLEPALRESSFVCPQETRDCINNLKLMLDEFDSVARPS